jgi:hypothetical protein
MRTVVILFWMAVLLPVAGRADTQQAVPAAEPSKPASRAPAQGQVPVSAVPSAEPNKRSWRAHGQQAVPSAEPNKPSSSGSDVEKTESSGKQGKEARDKDKEPKAQKEKKKSKPHKPDAARDQGIVPGGEPHP